MSELSDLVKILKNKKESGSDYIGIVSRVSGDTAYVQMTGSDIMDTPAAMTVDCKPGDRVRIRVNSGKAWITGNDTAPPTNDKDNVRKLTQKADDNDKRVNRMQKTVDETAGLAANTNQHFWVTEEGSDTGVHITEIPRKQFIADPEHGGGNLLARSNGIAIRDGLTELATMTDSGIRMGRPDSFHVDIGPNSIEMLDDTGNSGFRVSLSGNPMQRTVINTYNLSTSGTWETIFSAPIADHTITFSAVIRGTRYSATKTEAQMITEGQFNLGSSTDWISVQYRENNSFLARATATTATQWSASLQVSYTTTSDASKINFGGVNSLLWSGASFMGANSTAALSESVSEQLTGIVLAWSPYVNGAPANHNWHYQYVPKDHVLRGTQEYFVSSGLMVSSYGYIGAKYIYINDTSISGHAYNNQTNTWGGVTMTNSYWVLRYVLGV